SSPYQSRAGHDAPVEPASGRRSILVLLITMAQIPATSVWGRASTTDLRWLNRVTYGVSAATLTEYERLGRRRFIEAQLRADAETLPRTIADQIDQLEIQRQDGASLLLEVSA